MFVSGHVKHSKLLLRHAQKYLRYKRDVLDTETYDVIASNGIAYVVAKDGLYQFDYSNTSNIHLLSKMLK